MSEAFIHILIINWNGLSDSKNCLSSLLRSTCKNFHIYLLDNHSRLNELAELKKKFKKSPKISFYQSHKNLGFAGGNNFLLKQLKVLSRENHWVLFLNNDIEVPANFLPKITEGINKTKAHMLAVKMLQFKDRNKIDNLGLTVTITGLGKNRTSSEEPLFGPSGGCALYSSNALREIKKQTGDYFDQNYFCYAEDVDLAWRGLLLGFKSGYLPDVICYHKGGASSGGNFNKFVMYHTLRNTLFNVTKNLPAETFRSNLHRHLIFHLGLVTRYLFTSKCFVLPKVYRDYFKLRGLMKKKAQLIKQNTKAPPQELQKHFTPTTW